MVLLPYFLAVLLCSIIAPSSLPRAPPCSIRENGVSDRLLGELGREGDLDDRNVLSYTSGESYYMPRQW